MLLTQPNITSDWRGFNLYQGETYLVVDRHTAIADYVDEIQLFLEAEYPEDVYNYKPITKAEWLECLSNCTTTPEYHRANKDGKLNADTEI